MKPGFASLRLAAVVAAVGSPLAAQPPAAPAPPRFQAGVALVTLPVYVTGKDGKPVTGLTTADFEVTDEGKTVQVVGLHEIDAAEPVPAAASASTAVQAAARRQFLFLFDLSFSNPAGIVRARTAALNLAETALQPSDLVGVATYSARRGLRLLLGLTTDRPQLSRALDTLGVLDVQRAVDPLALTYELGPEAADPTARLGAGDEKWVEHIREEINAISRAEQAPYTQSVHDFLGSLQRLARGLDAVRGRKQVVLLSAGFDETALMGAQGEQARQDSQAVIEGRLWEVEGDRRFGDVKARSGMDDMAKAFAASDAVVHAVDVSGLLARGDVQEAGPGGRRGGGRESLAQIASQTGGRLVKDTNDVSAALGEIIESSRKGYVLAFEPVSRGAGKYHRLKVRVRSRGLTVSHRAGYLEPAVTRAADPQASGLQAAEAIAKGLSGGEIDVRMVAVPYRDGLGRPRLPVVLEVDGASLLSAEATGDLRLEVYGYAFDARGSVIDLVALTPTFTLSKLGDRLRASGLQLHTAFAVEPGPVDLRFLVRDTASGRMGSHRMSVVVPPFTAGSVVVSPPLFMADPAERIVVHTASRKVATPRMPFRVDADAFTPQALPRLANGRAESVCVLAFSPTPFDAKSSFQVSASLSDPAGVRVPLGSPLALARVVAETDGFRRFVLNVKPSGVPAGEYVFRVQIKDPLSGQTGESAQAVRVN